MPSLPTVGGSTDTWGTELNDFLSVGHDAAGNNIGSVIFDSILGSDTASIDTGAAGIPAGYNMIDIYIIARTTQAIVASTMIVRANNDSGAKYDLEEIRVNNTTVAGAITLAQTGWTFYCHGSTAETGAATYLRLTVPGYSETVFHKIGESALAANEDTASDNRFRTSAIRFKDTAAIDRISVTAGSGNLLTGSRMLIYGR